MVQVPILAGIYGKVGPDFERSYPLNLVPNVEETGISNGYLRTAPGAVTMGTGEGVDGGGIVWGGAGGDGKHYRLSGTSLVSVTAAGVVTVIGTVGAGPGIFDYSFDRLAVGAGLKLWLWNGTTLVEVTDPDLGDVVDMLWMDGYFVTTDGTSIVVTELNDPTAVDPSKYGSSEEDPDPVMGLLELRGELAVLNRHTIEFFRNAGTSGFPFARSRGATIPKGIVGTRAKVLFVETFAFVGSGRNEQPGVYLAGAGQAVKISNRALDKALAALSALELSQITLESRHGEGAQDLLVHLPDQTFVYSYNASQALDLPVWYRLASGTDGAEPYRVRGLTLAYGEWWCGDLESAAIGKLDPSITEQFGAESAWQFDAAMIFSPKGAICHLLELVGNFGRAPTGTEPRAFMSWTGDGLTFSQERSASIGGTGERAKRPAWRRNGMFRLWRSFRFRGVGGPPVSFSRLEAELEALGAG